MRTKIAFDGSAFIRSNGAAPRGRGSWVFATDSDPMLSGDTTYYEGGGSRLVSGDDVVWFTPSMTLAEARAWVRERANAWLNQNDIAIPELILYILP